MTEPKRVFRRKRRLQGSSFSSLYTGAELKEDGPWCRRCKQRHGYMHCKTSYDFGGKDPILLWLCPHFGHVIGELNLAHTKQDDAGTDQGKEGSPEVASGLEAGERTPDSGGEPLA